MFTADLDPIAVIISFVLALAGAVGLYALEPPNGTKDLWHEVNCHEATRSETSGRNLTIEFNCR